MMSRNRVHTLSNYRASKSPRTTNNLHTILNPDKLQVFQLNNIGLCQIQTSFHRQSNQQITYSRVRSATVSLVGIAIVSSTGEKGILHDQV